MTPFEKFAAEINGYPRVDPTKFSWIGDNLITDGNIVLSSRMIRLWGEEKEKVENALIQTFRKYTENYQVWVRLGPSVVSFTNEVTNVDGWLGFLRIAVLKKAPGA